MLGDALCQRSDPVEMQHDAGIEPISIPVYILASGQENSAQDNIVLIVLK